MKTKYSLIVLIALPAICAVGFALCAYATTGNDAHLGRGGTAIIVAIFGGFFGICYMLTGLVGLWIRKPRAHQKVPESCGGAWCLGMALFGFMISIFVSIAFGASSLSVLPILLLGIVPGAIIGLIVGTTSFSQPVGNGELT
jgi:hypothetical protein